mgnify:CR=1 FL=1
MTYKLELTTREAQVVYQALSKVWWTNSEADAEYQVRSKLEKISIKKYGRSLHDHLIEQGDLSENTQKPDLRTKKEKISDFIGELE